jgi:polar amino acid transport system substrate-binding protein
MRRTIRGIVGGLLVLAALGGCGRNEKTIAGFADVGDAKIGVMTGSTGEEIARKRFAQGEIKSFDDVMDAVAAIKSQQIDAIVTAYPLALQVVKSNPELRRLPEPLDNEDTAIAVRKGNDALLADVDRVIGDLRRDGTLEAMKKRWFKTDSAPYDEPEIAEPAGGKPLRIGVAATREPFSFVDRHGRVTGHDGELARRIGAQLGRPVEFADMKFMALIPALQSGKIDLIVSGMTATEERKKSVDFTQPYFANAQVMLVRQPAGVTAQPDATGSAAAPPGRLTTLDDIRDKRIALLVGSVHDKYTAEHYPQATILQYKSPSDLLLAVKSGKADVGMYTYETLLDLLRDADNADLGMLGEPLFFVPIGVGFNKQNDALRRQFNDFLAGIKQDGTFDDMVERWIRRGDTRMPKIANRRANGVLVVGNVSDKGLPFTVIKDNQLVGFDVELAERFGAYLGREVKVADMEFGSLIAAVASNKIDAIFSTLMITDERREKVAFSDPYYELGAAVVALRKNLASADAAATPRAAAPGFFARLADSFHSNIVAEDRYLLLWDGLKTTVIISVAASVFGTLLGALVCFMRMSRSAFATLPARAYIALLRGTPVLVLLMIIFYVVFASVDVSPVLVAVIAFGMNFAAYSAEIFRSGIEGIDKGQTEAGVSLGFTRLETFINIVLPQTVRRILPVYRGEFISLVKMTSIVGYIAVQDLTKASDIIRSRTFDAFFPLVMIAVLYFLISWVLMQALSALERRLDPRTQARKAGQA